VDSGARKTNTWSALVTAVDQVEKGATACYDLFFELQVPTLAGVEAVARAYREVGIRAVIAPMVADLTFYQSLPGLMEALEKVDGGKAGMMRMGARDAILQPLRKLAAEWPYAGDRLRLGIAPTIPHHCTREDEQGRHYKELHQILLWPAFGC
jgi:5-methylthioadenosine/S-adenosylhomocysteine deaminase